MTLQLHQKKKNNAWYRNKNVKKIVAKYKGMYDMECEDDEVVTTVTMLYK
ncbi:MAG: hypothetical protein ACLRR3_04595 [Eubacterium sp.]